MGKAYPDNYDFNQMERDMPNLEFITFNCPHCTDDEGNFATVVLYKPRDREIATQCNCNGQEEKCVELLNLIQSYNCEKMLNQLIARNDKKF